ncbi:uncharacterized protein [Diabrotica undecimpunctata]|uniref:uncharacterized protein n=1 Tax=Diabrotica undecimpunctata TaxID=50387 RepID=UPI003B63819F
MYSEKLNRSYSESDLYISQFDNLSVSVSSPRDYYKEQNSGCSIIRRIYVEEIVSPSRNLGDSTYSTFGNGKKSCSYNEIGNLCSPIYKETFCSPMYKRRDIYKVDDITAEPMDVDNSYTEERFPSMICPERVRSRQSKNKSNNQLLKSVNQTCKPELPFVNTTEDLDTDETDTKTENSESLPQLSQKIRVIHITHTKKNNNLYKSCVLFIVLAVAFYFYLYPNTIFVNSDIQIDGVKRDLETNIIGHTKIVENFIRLLQRRATWADKLKVVSFVGSQGVGKTYFARLVQKHFHHNLAHEIHASHLDYKVKRREILDAINSCCLNLIVIDDLTNTDSIELFEFAYSLPKDSFILLIAIYNTHYIDKSLNKVINYDDPIKIRNSFDNSGIKGYELFVFEELTSDQIRDWVQKELTSKNISSPHSKEIMETVLEKHDTKSGLKGLRSKVLLELQKYIN